MHYARVCVNIIIIIIIIYNIIYILSMCYISVHHLIARLVMLLFRLQRCRCGNEELWRCTHRFYSMNFGPQCSPARRHGIPQRHRRVARTSYPSLWSWRSSHGSNLHWRQHFHAHIQPSIQMAREKLEWESLESAELITLPPKLKETGTKMNQRCLTFMLQLLSNLQNRTCWIICGEYVTSKQLNFEVVWASTPTTCLCVKTMRTHIWKTVAGLVENPEDRSLVAKLLGFRICRAPLCFPTSTFFPCCLRDC